MCTHCVFSFMLRGFCYIDLLYSLFFFFNMSESSTSFSQEMPRTPFYRCIIVCLITSVNGHLVHFSFLIVSYFQLLETGMQHVLFSLHIYTQILRKLWDLFLEVELLNQNIGIFFHKETVKLPPGRLQRFTFATHSLSVPVPYTFTGAAYCQSVFIFTSMAVKRLYTSLL